jgi:hypothetical protein
VIRFAELYHQVKFPRALSLLHQWRGLAPLLHEARRFLSYPVTATTRRLPICINAESTPRSWSSICRSATRPAAACEAG